METTQPDARAAQQAIDSIPDDVLLQLPQGLRAMLGELPRLTDDAHADPASSPATRNVLAYLCALTGESLGDFARRKAADSRP